MAPLLRSARARFQPRDLEFVCEVLTGKRDGVEALQGLLEDTASFDLVLDHPKLLQALLTLRNPVEISPEFYFYLLVRHALREAGIDKVELADYVAATLADHAHSGNQVGSDDTATADFDYHVDYLRALQAAPAYEQFFLHVNCGNRFLVLTGLFPRFLRRREQRRGAPGVRYYEDVASESFRTASRHPLADEFALGEVYEQLAECFAETRRALNRLAQEYLFLDGK